jgi:RNA polymerase sigma factor (sigma-70 family)
MTLVVEQITPTGRVRKIRKPLTASQRTLAESVVRLGAAQAHRLKHYRRMDIDEAVAIAFEAITLSAADFDPARGISFPVFATIVARRNLKHAIDAAQAHEERFSQHRTEANEENTQDTRSPEPTRIVAMRETVAEIRAALPPRFFLALWLYYAEGMTMDEVSARIGNVSRERVRQIIQSATDRARRLFPELAQD